MSSPPPIFGPPVVRHPVRWALLCLGVVALLVATAAPAAAHADHEPLPEGFQARISQVVDATGSAASPGAEFTMAPDGGRVSVAYRGAGELVVFGEQANEPLLRISDGVAAVNVASPQAVQVEGADVDSGASAELIDLVWDRVPPTWEPLTSGPIVSFMDHRAVPGHPPVRAEFREGDVAATWSIPFTVDGAEYALTGDVVATTAPATGSSRSLIVAAGGVLFVLLFAGFVLRGWRAIVRRPVAGAPPSDDTTGKELVGSR